MNTPDLIEALQALARIFRSKAPQETQVPEKP